jgi:hypothetical protein
MNALLIALAISWAAPAQDANPKVTLETSATYAEKAFEKLSEAAGIRLTASAQTKDEILILRVRDVPLNDLLAKIALATNAEWVREDGGYRLIRSAALLRQQEKARIEWLAKSYVEAQKKLQDEIAKQEAFDESAARNIGAQLQGALDSAKQRGNVEGPSYQVLERLASSTPPGRLAKRIVAQIPAKDLAGMRSPGRIVYSTAPNPMQRALPKSCLQALSQFESEMQAFRPFIPEIGEQIYTANLQYLARYASVKDNRITKALLVVRSYESGRSGNLSFQLKLANAKGQILSSSYSSLPVPSEMGPPPGQPAPDPSGEKPISLSPLSRELVEFLKLGLARGGDPANMPPLGPNVRNIVLNPESRTICELVASDILLAVANQRDLQLVACVSDVFGLFSAMMLGPADVSPGKALERLRQPMYDTVVEKQEPNWLIARALDPVMSRRMKVDLSALGALLRATDRRGTIFLSDISAFAAAAPEDFERIGLMIRFIVALPKALRVLEQWNWQLLRFHGMLPEAPRRFLESGGKLPYAQLGPAHKKIYGILFFEESDNMGSVTRAMGRAEMQEDEDERFGGETLRWEPTERMPNGIPPSAWVALRSGEDAIVRAKGTYNGSPADSNMDPQGLAMYLLSKEGGAPGTFDHYSRFQYESYSYLERRTHEYSFFTDESYGLTTRLEETLSESKPVKTIDELPAEFLKRVKAIMAEQRASRRVPPPSRPRAKSK